jgi:hypothetical protein
VSEHLSLDELAELDAGLLPRRRAATRHLADCEECSAKADALRRTQERLRDLGPVSIPRAVADRLDVALSTATATGGEDVVPDLAAYRAKRFGGIPPWAYASAAAVVVLGGTAIAVGALRDGKPNATEGALAPLVVTSPTHSGALVLQESGRTYTPGSIAGLAAALTAAPGDSVALSATTPEFAGTGGDSQATGPSAGSGAGVAPSHSNKARRGAVPPAPTLAAPAQVAGDRAQPIAPSLRRLADSRAALLRCAAFITDTPGATPIAVDFGRWTNKAAGLHRVPSVVLVFEDTDDPETIDVFVVAAACDDSSLLDFEVLDRTP